MDQCGLICTLAIGLHQTSTFEFFIYGEVKTSLLAYT